MADIRTDAEVLAAELPLRGRTVLDIGCGDGSLVRWLVAQGADALGVEVTADAVEDARSEDPEHPERYRVGRAEALPLEAAAVDAAVLMRSLHHVPPGAVDDALHELARVVRPGGLVHVAEPVPAGALFALVSLVDDETDALAGARAALARAGRHGLARLRTAEYLRQLRFPGFEAFRAHMIAVDPARAERFAAREAELRRGFGDGEFLAPMRVDVLHVRT